MLIYNTLLRIVAPAVALYLRATPRHRVLLERFYRGSRHEEVPADAVARVWVHAASLGETVTASPFIRALKARWPNVEILLTVSTVTGMEQASRSGGADRVVWCPFDLSSAVERFYDQFQPTLLILIETEIWPNLLNAAYGRSIPVVVVNARISEKHFKRYWRFRRFFAPVLERITTVCAQSRVDAERYEALGVPSERIEVVGNSKFDGAVRTIPSTTEQGLRERYGFDARDPILVFGSTRPGDERRALKLQEELRKKGAVARLVIVPRHVTRVSEIAAENPGTTFIRHSECDTRSQGGVTNVDAVLLVDTTGELSHFYAMADIAIVGGSFSDDVQGHNPIEPAALGIPVVFGPCMKNFLVVAQVLVEAGAAVQLQDESELSAAVEGLLRDKAVLANMAAAARKAVDENSGAVSRSLQLIEGTFNGIL